MAEIKHGRKSRTLIRLLGHPREAEYQRARSASHLVTSPRRRFLEEGTAAWIQTSHLLRHVPGEHESHDFVTEVGGGAEHAWTASVDHGDTALPAVLGRGV
jgi:hypothetical protein